MKILFMCVANSARSQLAEGLARNVFGPEVEVRSAGSKPSKVNPFAIQVMNEVGIELTAQYSKSVDDLSSEFADHIDYVITLCAEEVCPVVISKAKKLHWPFPDPASKEMLSDAEMLARFRAARNSIREKIVQFKNEVLGK